MNDITITELTEPLPSTLCHLYLCGTRIRRLPPLPASLYVLNVSDTLLTELPPLPPGLQSLVITNTQIRALPSPLPPHLTVLHAAGTPIEHVESLPSSLHTLSVENCTRLRTLPATIPPSVRALLTRGCSSLMVRRAPMEDVRAYRARWAHWWRQRSYREELIAAAWHPRRLLNWCIDDDERREWSLCATENAPLTIGENGDARTV